MKAYVKRADPDGFIRLGGESTTITKEYKTVKALLQYGATPFLHVWGGVVEVYKNWDNRYGEPDMKVTVLGNVPAQIEELEKRRQYCQMQADTSIYSYERQAWRQELRVCRERLERLHEEQKKGVAK